MCFVIFANWIFFTRNTNYIFATFTFFATLRFANYILNRAPRVLPADTWLAVCRYIYIYIYIYSRTCATVAETQYMGHGGEQHTSCAKNTNIPNKSDSLTRSRSIWYISCIPYILYYPIFNYIVL